MEIQSLSLCVPAKCPNKCPFCVSRQHHEEYKEVASDDAYWAAVRSRLQFARDNHCNTIVLTGSGEPMANLPYLIRFGSINSTLSSPFQWIEIQTSGVYLGPNILSLRTWDIGVATISLSLANMFDSDANAELMGILKKLRFNTVKLCESIKELGFNLRLSLNMSDIYNEVAPEKFFETAKELDADQITFRELYAAESDSKQAEWVKEHSYARNACKYMTVKEHVERYGRRLERLSFGSDRYSLDGLSVVIDDNCMDRERAKLFWPVHPFHDFPFPTKTLRYLILREDGKLYTKWDDKGSLLF